MHDMMRIDVLASPCLYSGTTIARTINGKTLWITQVMSCEVQHGLKSEPYSLNFKLMHIEGVHVIKKNHGSKSYLFWNKPKEPCEQISQLSYLCRTISSFFYFKIWILWLE